MSASAYYEDSDEKQGLFGWALSLIVPRDDDEKTTEQLSRAAKSETRRRTREAERAIRKNEANEKLLTSKLEKTIKDGRASNAQVRQIARSIQKERTAIQRQTAFQSTMRDAELNIDQLHATAASAQAVENLAAISEQLTDQYGLSNVQQAVFRYEKHNVEANTIQEFANEALYSAAENDDDDAQAANLSLDGNDSTNSAAIDAILTEARTRVETMRSLEKTVVTSHAVPVKIENTEDLLLVQRLRDLQNKE